MPLTPSILSNPNHRITRHLLYIYSMECFIYQDLNKVCRNQDRSQIKYFGAFAAALSYIINYANGSRKDKLYGQTILYRGLKLDPMELESYEIDRKVRLSGYTSSSMDA